MTCWMLDVDENITAVCLTLVFFWFFFLAAEESQTSLNRRDTFTRGGTSVLFLYNSKGGVACHAEGLKKILEVSPWR